MYGIISSSSSYDDQFEDIKSLKNAIMNSGYYHGDIEAWNYKGTWRMKYGYHYGEWRDTGHTQLKIIIKILWV